MDGEFVGEDGGKRGEFLRALIVGAGEIFGGQDHVVVIVSEVRVSVQATLGECVVRDCVW